MHSRKQDQLITETERRRDSGNAFAALRQFARKRKPVERCELCSLELGREHPHLIELAARKLVCACDACALLFDGRSDGRYKRVSRRVCALNNFHLSDAQWDSLDDPHQYGFLFQLQH